MKKLLILSFLAAGMIFSQRSPQDRDSDGDVNLPNGKSQKEEILKADFKKTLEDSADLVKLAQELHDDLVKDDRHVLSISTLKKTEDIEKLAKTIRTRLKR